jgi:ABC-type taurine transport system substrate-binding protein
MKSAKTWDLMAFRGANEIVSPMISTAHFAILPEASQHWMISPRGKDDTTVTG